MSRTCFDLYSMKGSLDFEKKKESFSFVASHIQLQCYGRTAHQEGLASEILLGHP